MKLGKLEQITDLRSVWKHEAKDFTPWLAKEENLEILSEAVGIDIVVEEQESNVGDFSVDLFATEEGTGRRIIIENQLEETNHDHLGKIITYASGKEAEVIIWIVRKARDEHKQAIEWLNQHTDDKFEFFDAENIKIAYIIDVQIIVRDMKCVGDILGTEFCWPKEKKIKYKIAFYPISEVMFPKDMKDKCNPRKRSIIGV